MNNKEHWMRSISFRGTKRERDIVTAAARLEGMGTGDLVRLALETSPEAREIIGRVAPDFFAGRGDNLTTQ